MNSSIYILLIWKRMPVVYRSLHAGPNAAFLRHTLVIYGYSCSKAVYWANRFHVFSSVLVNMSRCDEYISLLCGFCKGGLSVPLTHLYFQTLMF